MADLPKRKTVRIPDYDYSTPGTYFITVCIADRKPILWNVGAAICRQELSKTGRLVEAAILQIPQKYPMISVDKYCVMPDHIHFLIFIKSERATARVAPTLGRLVGAYKSLVSNEWRKICNERNETCGKLWQRNYYEHIIRDKQDFEEIKEYISDNPARRYFEED